MIVPDVNLLLYAHILGFPQHAKAKRWWESLMNGTQEIGVAAPALFGFVRIATNPRIFSPPMAVTAAVGAAEGWFERAHVRFLLPGPRHLEIAFDLLRKLGAATNLTTDIQLAALAIEYQGELHSNDADFSRFPGVRWSNPLR